VHIAGFPLASALPFTSLRSSLKIKDKTREDLGLLAEERARFRVTAASQRQTCSFSLCWEEFPGSSHSEKKRDLQINAVLILIPSKEQYKTQVTWQRILLDTQHRQKTCVSPSLLQSECAPPHSCLEA
jgi:hypothetical protein